MPNTMLNPRTKRYSVLALVAAASLFFMSGSANAQGEGESIEDLPVVAEETGNEDDTENLTARVHELTRVSGELVILTWSTDNSGDRADAFSLFVNDEYEYQKKGAPVSGITLLNPEENLRFQPLMDSSQYCLCTETTGEIHENHIDTDEQYISYSSYFVDDETETVSVEIDGFPEIEDIPIE